MATEYLNNKFLEGAIKRFQKSKQEKIRYQLIMEDLQTSIQIRLQYSKEPNHDIKFYVTEFETACTNYTDSQKELATAFYTLSEHLVRYAKDIIVDQDDAIQEGVMICFEKIDRFNPDIGKAFNYMTTCILNHFRQIYRTSKNYKLLKEKYRDFMISRMSNTIIKNGREIHMGD
jgi:hypothetical protein